MVSDTKRLLQLREQPALQILAQDADQDLIQPEKAEPEDGLQSMKEAEQPAMPAEPIHGLLYRMPDAPDQEKHPLHAKVKHQHQPDLLTSVRQVKDQTRVVAPLHLTNELINMEAPKADARHRRIKDPKLPGHKRRKPKGNNLPKFSVSSLPKHSASRSPILHPATPSPEAVKNILHPLTAIQER